MSDQPLISVAIPAYRATSTLHRAVTSVLSGGLSADQIEIVVASDDGHDYAPDFTKVPSVRFTQIGPVRTGVGPARNRALSACRGQYVTYLDADDHWAPGMLTSLLPLLEKNGLACPPTEIRAGTITLLTVPDGPALTFDQMSMSGASFRPVFRRDMSGVFRNALAQDIFHMVELLALAGGKCPVGTVPYILELGTESVSAADDYSERLIGTYKSYAEDIHEGKTRVPSEWALQAAAVFDAKLALNEAYMLNGKGRSFYQFIVDERLNNNA